MRSAYSLVVLFAFVITLAGCGDVGKAPEAITTQAVALTEVQGETFAIDTTQSSINWRGAKVTGAHDGGFKNYSGTVTVDGNNVAGVDVVIDATSLHTTPARLVEHLKSDDFFKTAANPTATFKATQIVPSTEAGATHAVTGNLTMAGQTNSVTFPATIAVSSDRVTAKADFIINRQNWGMAYPGKPDDLINDDVRIMLDVVAVKGQ